MADRVLAGDHLCIGLEDDDAVVGVEDPAHGIQRAHCLACLDADPRITQ
jgi:hypothetical protein